MELLEAEGRVAKRAAIEYALAVLLWFGATVFFVVAAFALCTALYLALASVAHPAVALIVVAVFLLAIGVVCFLIGRGIVQQPGNPQ